MPKKTSRKRWTEVELTKLREFIELKAEILLTNFYKNIKEGRIKYRKPSKFFSEMGDFLKMTPTQCKSKFQKFEKEIFTNYLQLPDRSYFVLEHIRRQKIRSRCELDFCEQKKGAQHTKGAIPIKKKGSFGCGRAQTLRMISSRLKRAGDNLRMDTTDNEPDSRRNQIEIWRLQIVEFYNQNIISFPKLLVGISYCRKNLE